MLIHTRDMSAPGPVEAVKEMTFSISHDEKDEEFAMEVLSAQLYSDKLKIICQEYLANARDAHRDAGKADIPVEVHLPTTDEPWYEVSDHGNGISPENFETVFMRYFASTKRGDDTISKRSNGGFGLGAKSAWSYVPEFFVNTVHDGIEYCRHCYRNGDNKRVAALTSKSRIGKDEHSGTSIRVNIKLEDINLFRGKFADITLMWGVKPKVVNAWTYTTFGAQDIIYEDNDVTVYERNRGARNNLTALVDDIPYPVDVRVIHDFLTEGERKFALNAAAYIHCDKLEVDPTPNRENLEYNNRTRDYIVAKVKAAYTAVTNLAQSKIDAATSYWNACCLWTSDESIKNLCRIIDSPKYNGISLPNDNENVSYDNTYRRGKERTSVYFASFNKGVDGSIKVREVVDTSKHRFDPNTPFVYQIGGMPQKCHDKMVALYHTLIKDTVNHGEINGLNLVRLPSEASSQKEVLDRLEKNYNWSKMLKYDLAEVEVPKVKTQRGKGSVKGIFYEISNDYSPRLTKVSVDFRGRSDVYVAIKNKTVTLFGKRYRYDSSEMKSFKKLTGIDFSQVKLYAVPERFVKRLAKVKTMRSLEDAVTKAANDYNNNTPFEYVISKYNNRGGLHVILGSIGSSAKEVYNVISGTISEDSVLARVAKLKDEGGGKSLALTDMESLIIWYLRETKVRDVDAKTEDTPEMREARKLVEVYKRNYDTLFGMVSTYNLRGYADRCKMMSEIVNMIEGKIAIAV
jgi:anti-sigma regulatory factor (Ser/Thr protein kinase)